MLTTVELLSPARNAEIGRAAITHGADAVYIGAERFGARAEAGNSVADIGGLAAFAHRYGARVYVTVNTLFRTDDELEQARRLVWQLSEAGVDAIIVQDTRLAFADLPPIELHASTQADIRTPERVAELRRMGFSQVVLARELTTQEIGTIARTTDCVVECFVHGALCVCYSGRCYMSEAVTGRSANRGECAQMCRLPYDLVDDHDRVLLRNKYLLSLKDFDASAHLAEMIDAGVRSFKIEGRLKDINYVKNITARYRSLLDNLLETKGLAPASLGRTELNFRPDVRRTFYRGGTDYFLSGNRPDALCTMITSKAMGEPVANAAALVNGDGVCWQDKATGELRGMNIDGRRLPPRGVQLYRNNDIEFERALARPDSAVRRIDIYITVDETDTGYRLTAQPFGVSVEVTDEHQTARNAAQAGAAWAEQLGRLGDTEFRLAAPPELHTAEPRFVPVSRLAQWRRAIVEELRRHIAANIRHTPHAAPMPDARPDTPPTDIPHELMRCRYCIRHEIGQCLKQREAYRGSLTLRNSAGRRFTLGFDCRRCEMTITQDAENNQQ